MNIPNLIDLLKDALALNNVNLLHGTLDKISLQGLSSRDFKEIINHK
jgi:hypothetical protein